MRSLDETIPEACRRIYALAERDPHRALGLARSALEHMPDANQIGRAWAQYTLGWSLLCWERYDAARIDFADAQATIAALGIDIGALRCRFALAIAGVLQFGQDDPAQELDVLANRFEVVGMSLEAQRCQLYQAILFNILGRPEDAERALARIEHASRQAGPLDHARWLRVAAVAAIARRNFSQAIGQLQQAEQIFAAAHQPLELAKTWFQHAWALLSQEQLDDALAYYTRAEQTFVRLDLPQRRAWCAKNIGLLLTRRGHYDQALHALLRASAIFETLGSPADVAGCQLNLGNIYFYAGLWEPALAWYARAEAGFAGAGMRGDRLIARRNAAMASNAQGRSDVAAALLADLEAEALADNNRAELAAIWYEQALILALQDRRAEADTRFWRARELNLAIEHWLGAADCAIEQGLLALDATDHVAAQSHFTFVAPLVTLHPYNRWRNEHGLARCAAARGDLPAAFAHYRVALDIVADLRQRLASEETSSRIYAQAALLHADALRLAAEHGTPDLVLAIGERQRTLAFKRMLATGAELPAAYRAEHNRLRVTINILLSSDATEAEAHASALDAALAAYGELLLHARHSAGVASADLEHTPFDRDEVRKMLTETHASEWTALVYMLCEPDLLIGIVTDEAFTIARVPYDGEFEDLIAKAVQPAYRRFVYRDLPYHQGVAARRWQILRDLGDRLLPPAVRARLNPQHRLLIIPAGPLHGLPWAALRLDEQWLAARAIVQIVPSLLTWPVLAERRAPETALLIGCSEFGARAPALPAVQAELAAIAPQWPGPVEQLSEQQASRVALLERSASGELAHYGLLHLATHARMLPQRGLAAHVKLWDDDLLLPEIAELHLAGCLVVLSACAGAAADQLPGEEMLSLSWAFLIAGARGVLASLWRVDDRSVAHFMAVFYAELRVCRDSALALAYAQRSFMSLEQADSSADLGPQCWASFVLTGSASMFA
jgi:tetratricopeptide (TPR) repeat protein